MVIWSLPTELPFSTLAPIPDCKVFEREGVQLNLSFTRPPETPALLLITVTTTNSSGGDVTHFICQAAVPKVCKDQTAEVAWVGTSGGKALKWMWWWMSPGW